MMLQNDVFLAFKELGWKIGRDEVGERLASYSLGDVEITIIMRLEPRRIGKRLLIYKSVGLCKLDAIIGDISDRKPVHVPIITGDEDIRQLEFGFSDIRSLSKRLIEWGEGQDIKAALRKLRELPTDAKGAFPRRHLGALALAGDVGRLKFYQQAFERGDRLGFVPYVSKDMIDRAVEIAKAATAVS
ncbi:hypothetical protein J2X72_003054 [Phyllobacterium sp. 1468]|uniref:DUF6990 domain-containing protein n=1 Tax=Phyllobacterium sp. 1468 TaxID=2817759 RepID=UPI002856FA6F|nr:hypothetical protein [Phyllobacterium sp. 1468]MDR6634244.1 hypothetical protein [Phyllobacterium sp. 1468]